MPESNRCERSECPERAPDGRRGPLARAGVTVRLLDRSKFPRNKPCGGGISLRVLKRFPYLEPALARIATHTVSRLYLEGPDGESTIVESRRAGGADDPPRRVRRAAGRAGVRSRRGVGRTASTSLRPSQDANGVTADVARRPDVRRAGRDRRRRRAQRRRAAARDLNPGWPATAIALDMMEETPRADAARRRSVDAVGGVRVRARRRQGHGRARRAEGYALHLSEARSRQRRHRLRAGPLPRGRSTRSYELQRGFVEHLRGRGVIEGESVRTNFTPFLIPVGGPLRRPGRGRVLLAGDAGGFVNGFTAEGIYYAMVSGELAARRVVESVRRRRRVDWRGAIAAPCDARNWRGAAGFRPDSAVSVRRSPPNCARRSTGARACAGDDPPDPRFRGRTGLRIERCGAGSSRGRRSWRRGSLWERLRTLIAAERRGRSGQPDGIASTTAVRAPAAARRLRRAARRARCLPPDGLPRSGRLADQLRADPRRRRYARSGSPATSQVAAPGRVFSPNTVITDARQRWLFRMVHTNRPLQEKMTLFWHNHFATAYTKIAGRRSARPKRRATWRRSRPRIRAACAARSRCCATTRSATSATSWSTSRKTPRC